MFGENGEGIIFRERNVFLVSGLKAFVQFTLTCLADELTILLAGNYADTEGRPSRFIFEFGDRLNGHL